MMQQQINQEQTMSHQQQQQLQQQQLQQQQLQQQQQQLAQQMVLCPVRVVYETQILMPPGEQVQQHQTYFVNPQNQPPWATQNTSMFPQNQMLYVQQMQPNNIVPTAQPNMDQNQMFIQQTYPTMQQVVANQNMQVLAQNMQDRQVLRQPVQFANVPGTMNVINMNQYGQMIGMHQMANMGQNIPNIVQPQNVNQNLQNIQMIQNQTRSPKPPEVQQNFNIIRSPMPQTNVRPSVTVTPQQIMARNMQQQNVINLQQNVANPVQAQPMNQNTLVQNIQQGPSTSQSQPSRVAVQNNTRQTYTPNMVQNTSQQTHAQKQNVGSPQTTNVQRSLPNVFTPQNQNVFVRQNVPMEVANSSSLTPAPPTSYILNTPNQSKATNNSSSFTPAPATSYILNTPNQNKSVNNLKVGIPSTMHNNNTQNSNVQIRPRTVIPTQTTQIKVVPRPQSHQQVRNIPQLKPMGMQTSLIQMQNMASIYPNMQSATATVTSAMNVINQGVAGNVLHQSSINKKVQTSSVSTETIGLNSSPATIENRKRKSESPDEFRNKVSVITATQLNFSSTKNTDNFKTIEDKRNNCNEIGVNTSPTRKFNVNAIVPAVQPEKTNIPNVPLIQPAKIETQNVKTELVNTPPSVQEGYSDKLIRNTVYAQARVRKISSSSTESKNNEMVIDQQMNKVESKAEEMVIDQKVNKVASKVEEVTVNQIKKEEITIPVAQTKAEPNEVKPKTEEKSKDPINTAAQYVKQEPVEDKKRELSSDTKVNIKTNTDSDRINDRLQQKIMDFNGKEIELSHGNIHKRDGKESNYILTHVLDGIVIQESNVAFPIRLPLKEKMLPPNTSIVAPTVQKTETKLEEDKKAKEPKLEEMKTSDTKILTISELKLDGKTEELEKSNSQSIDKDNPFHCSKPQAIKTWTAEELATHLSEKGWHETASILREHEIDGEALFLVSSAQLLEIGINENHAMSLCDFVKS